MIGLLMQLALSWLLAWLFEKRNLSILGFAPTKNRLLHFIIFFGITATICAAGHLAKSIVGNFHWKINPALSIKLVVSGLWWNLRSVLFEELIFRGVLLYILIKKAGATRAILFSAMGFGIYHWFSFGVIGNPLQMTIVFLTTGAMGLVLAYAYAKTLSLYIPVAIHLAWNFTQIFIFSDGPIGKGLLIADNATGYRTNSYAVYFSVLLLPTFLTLGINYFLIKRLSSRSVPTS